MQAVITLEILTASIANIIISTNTIDIINNTLSVIVIDQLDNLASLAYFHWLRTFYNILVTQADFLELKSTPPIEFNQLFVIIGFIGKTIADVVNIYNDCYLDAYASYDTVSMQLRQYFK